MSEVEDIIIVKDSKINKINKTEKKIQEENELFSRQFGERMPDNKPTGTEDSGTTENMDLTQEVLDTRTSTKEVIVEKVQEKTMVKSSISKKHVSLNFGVVGSGQAGGRIAEVFNRYGYNVVALNTAEQDLEFLQIDTDRKYLVKMESKTLGGAGKDLEIGAASVDENEDEIREFIEDNLPDSEAMVLAISGGGGSGSGSAETLCHLLYETGKPVIVIYILPGAFDDPQSKHNAVVTLAKLSDLANQQVINSLILVDNANIERILGSQSQATFFDTANQAIVEPLHMFNSVSVTPTNFEALDSMDFAKSLIEAGNCVVFGTNKVSKEQYENDEMAIMDSIIEGLEDGLLASGFELREAQNVGILVTANQSVLEKIPFTSIAFMFKYVADEFDSAKSFKGVYAIPSDDDDITVRFIFSGMGLPKERVNSLKEEAESHMKVIETKRKATSLNVGLKRDKATDQIDRQIAKAKRKKTGIGKLIGGGGQRPVKRRR